MRRRLPQVLSTPPVLADDTTYTATMRNDAGEYTTLVREHSTRSAAALWERKLAHVSRELQQVLLTDRLEPLHARAAERLEAGLLAAEVAGLWTPWTAHAAALLRSIP